MRELSLGPLDTAWYVFLLVTGAQVGIPTALLGCVVLGLFGSVLAIAIARARASAAADAEPAATPPRPAAVGPATRLHGAPERKGRSLLRR
jgi:hypothetical protein